MCTSQSIKLFGVHIFLTDNFSGVRFLQTTFAIRILSKVNFAFFELVNNFLYTHFVVGQIFRRVGLKYVAEYFRSNPRLLSAMWF